MLFSVHQVSNLPGSCCTNLVSVGGLTYLVDWASFKFEPARVNCSVSGLLAVCEGEQRDKPSDA